MACKVEILLAVQGLENLYCDVSTETPHAGSFHDRGCPLRKWDDVRAEGVAKMEGKIRPIFEKEMCGSIQHAGCIGYDRLLSERFELVSP